jgi:hypothetical protein
MTLALRVPKIFYDDCVACGTPVPEIMKTTKRHYWLNTERSERESWDDIKDRAEFYVSLAKWHTHSPLAIREWKPAHTVRRLGRAAKAFLNALDTAKGNSALVRNIPNRS